MSVRTFTLVVLHELKLLARNRKLLLSHTFAMLAGFALFVTIIKRGVAPLVPVFFLLLLTVPAVGSPMGIGLHMFVGEKERRTMEPLLLLPVALRSFLGAKFATMLAVLVGELTFFFLAGIVALRVWASPFLYALAMNPTTTYIAGILMPLLGVLVGLIAMIVSARATSAQSAMQTMTLVIIPCMVLLGMVMMQGGAIITRSRLVSGTAVLVILNAVAYGIAVWMLKPQALIRKRGQ